MTASPPSTSLVPPAAARTAQAPCSASAAPGGCPPLLRPGLRHSKPPGRCGLGRAVGTERRAEPGAPRGDALVLASTRAAGTGDDDRVHGVVRVHHLQGRPVPCSVTVTAAVACALALASPARPPAFPPSVDRPAAPLSPAPATEIPAPRAATRPWKRLRSSIAPSPPPTAPLPLRSSFRPSEGGGRFGKRRSRASMGPSGNRSPFDPSAQSTKTSSRPSTGTGQRGPRAKAPRSSKPNPFASRRSFEAFAPIADAFAITVVQQPCLHRPHQDSFAGTRSCWPSLRPWCC